MQNAPSSTTVDLREGYVSQHLQTLHSTRSRFKLVESLLSIFLLLRVNSARKNGFGTCTDNGFKISDLEKATFCSKPAFFIVLLDFIKYKCLTTVSRQFRAEVDKIWILK